ncbi:MAG: hypothetical protein ABSH17_08510, partial [Syntrophobacteraceae bacterium]
MLADASALMALYDPSDSFHKAATEFRYNFILHYSVHLFTSNYILAEALSHMTGLGEKKLRSLMDEIRAPRDNSLQITELWVTPEI